MADIIQLLPDHVANQIAAGEVVQRPASVVKELLENAIDAKATDIKLLVKDAGKALIQVMDNGSGMSATDARLCFERHATSKIKSADDLFNIQTKGFRGEALASIAAIAHVELKTRLNHDELGNFIRIEGSEVVEQEFINTPKGSSIAVKNLFYNIPARRNFLKSNTIEMRHIIDEFLRVSLAHPSISFSLYHNDQEVYHLPISNLRQRIVSVFGSKTNEKLVPIKEETEILTLEGFVIKPEFAKKKRGEQFFFVNERFIKSGYLNHAITSAFEGLLPDGSIPSFFLFMNVPPQSIDINIHPTKTEIKFDNEQSIYSIIRSTVKHSLGQYNIAPLLDFERDANLDTPYQYKDKNPTQNPTIEVDRNFNPFKESYSSTNKPSKIDIKQHIDFITFESELSQEKLFLDNQKSQYKTYQIQGKYIISSVKSGVILIHQQYAHERILYEDLFKSTSFNEQPIQQLLFPLKIYFDTIEIELLKSIADEIMNLGIEIQSFTTDAIIISGIPSLIQEDKIVSIFEELIHTFQQDIPMDSFSITDLIIKSMSKNLSIKTGTKLSEKEQEELVNKLFICKEPSISPFGKKTFTTLTLEDFDNYFN
ncbi:MAG: DNA mismatch repair endonuclease MutL [Flavobacteriaceae bacterium]|nr:DNA mismatch repair endonuclease MutL [Flavobacteriaceae bacterium]